MFRHTLERHKFLLILPFALPSFGACGGSEQRYATCQQELAAAKTEIAAKDKLLAQATRLLEDSNADRSRLSKESQDTKGTDKPVGQSAQAPRSANDIRTYLTETIRQRQDENVKDSLSESNCFTNEDLKLFLHSGGGSRVATELENDEEFGNAAKQFTALSPQEKSNILNAARKTVKKTWAQIGSIGSEGQTDAGQVAERQIAKSITDSFVRLSKNRQGTIVLPSK